VQHKCVARQFFLYIKWASEIGAGKLSQDEITANVDFIMRIVQVSVGSVRMPPKEGSAPLQVIFNTSKHLARLGHQVVILDRRYTKDDPPVEHIDGVEIVRLRAPQVPSPKSPAFIRFILAELNAILFAIAVSCHVRKDRSKVDIIHLHLTSIGLVVITLNRAIRGKTFYTCHLSQWTFVTSGLRFSERIHLLLDAYLMRRVRKVIALSDAAKESFISFGKAKRDNIVVLPNGVDANFFNPNTPSNEITNRYSLEGKSTVLFVGRLAKIKGVDYLLKAVDIIVNKLRYKDTIFILVGPHTFAGVDNPLGMDEILSYIEQHQLGKNIILTGSLPLEEVRVLYAASDIFVLPSLAEGDPLVTLEAMASGKPVIGTRVGGIPHHICDGWNGFLIDPANEQQLADKIKYLIDNPEERKRMGANSRKYAEEEFDWKKVAEKLLAVYQS
jgi:glycosyltransferase involved in cell wall biosynthesis